jgi:hypothetical protein
MEMALWSSRSMMLTIFGQTVSECPHQQAYTFRVLVFDGPVRYRRYVGRSNGSRSVRLMPDEVEKE